MHAAIFEEAAQRFPGEHLEVRGYTLTGPASASPHGNGALTGLILILIMKRKSLPKMVERSI